MHRIDTPTAQKDKFGAGKNGFTRGNPQTGTPATDLDDDYFDMLQEELAGVVEASGVNLEKSKHNQLLTALKALLLSRAHPFADIKADGPAAIAEALSNLGISDLIKLDTANAKWQWKLPNGVIFQVFKTDVQNASTVGVTRDNDITFPVAFPSECFAALVCKTTYVQTVVSAELVTRTGCKIVAMPVTTPLATWTNTTILAIGR